jgi:putative NIF3 family GTP cyclohydrolase 1 type 2
MPLAELAELAARVLPATRWGVRAAGDPARMISTVGVCGGSGDAYLGDAITSGVDAYFTADLRHHPASEHLAVSGPALLDAAHWATERPWLDDLATLLRSELGVTAVVSDLPTDPWNLHAPSPAPAGDPDTDTKSPGPAGDPDTDTKSPGQAGDPDTDTKSPA